MYKEIISETFNRIIKKKHQLLKALLIPLFLIVTIDISSNYFSQEQNKFFFSISSLFLFVINILISITTHRVLLMKNNAVPTWGLYKFGKREFKFLFYTLLIIIIIFIVLATILFFVSIFVNPNDTLFILLILGFTAIFGIFLFVRFSLVLPSIALEQTLSFFDSWIITSKYKILCMLTIVIIPSIVAVIITFIYGIVIEFLISVIWDKFYFLNSLLNLFINVFIISALSATYKFLVPNNYFDKEEINL